jgi:hypothetical protein
MVIDAMKKDLEKPSAAIRSWLEPVKGLPRLEVNFLSHVFRSGPVAKNTSGGSEDIVQVRHCLRFEAIRCGSGGIVRRQRGHALLGKIVSHPSLGGFGTCHICH